MKRCLEISALLMMSAMGLARAGDREDVLAVMDQYFKHEESGNMIEQGKLMTHDRSMVYVGGRLTGDNRKLMTEQQAAEDQQAKNFPGVRYDYEIKDVELQLYNGDSALATFVTQPTRIVPSTLPTEKVKALGPSKTPLIVALMLVKQAGAWKIASSTFVAAEKPKDCH